MKKNKWLLWTVVITLSVVIAFGAVLGTVAYIRASRAVLQYEGVYMSKGTYSYLCSFRKTQFLTALSTEVDVSDTKAFYAKDRGDGVTYGEALRAYVDEYVRTLTVSAYMFDRLTGLTSTEKARIREAVDAIVADRAEGDRRAFDRQLEPYGCTYRDILDAVTMQYKANRLFLLLYGEGGSYVSRDTEACESYYRDAYVHARLLFIRTETRVLTDEAGEHTVVELTESERAERAADIARVDAAILALKNGESGAMTDTMMTFYMDKYGDGEPAYDDSGWYFSEASRLFGDFSADFPEVAEAVMQAPIGEYIKVPCAIGVCYIYREELPEGAYLDEDLGDFFSDFYFDCATSLHMTPLLEEGKKVKTTALFDTVDPVAVPKNTVYLVTVPS